MKIFKAFLVVVAAPFLFYHFSGIEIWAAESKACKHENYKMLSSLYQNPTEEMAGKVFEVLACEGGFSKPTKVKPYVALIGGYMRTNPKLLEKLYAGVSNAKDMNAPKLFLDALWFCGTEPCRAKLRARPFNLPQKDVDALLRETPPDPYTLAIDSPAALDLLWGYFTGSGENKIPQRIFDFVRSNWNLYDSTGSVTVEKLQLLRSARWSFVSMAAQHKKVRAVIDSLKNTSPEARALLTEVNKELSERH